MPDSLEEENSFFGFASRAKKFFFIPPTRREQRAVAIKRGNGKIRKGNNIAPRGGGKITLRCSVLRLQKMCSLRWILLFRAFISPRWSRRAKERKRKFPHIFRIFLWLVHMRRRRYHVFGFINACCRTLCYLNYQKKEINARVKINDFVPGSAHLNNKARGTMDGGLHTDD